MYSYRAPLRDIRFVVHDVLDFVDHYRTFGRDDLSADLLEGILEEGARFAETVLAPTNRTGDEDGLREMARVTRSGGVVAACVWDHEGGSGPLSLFWQAAHDVDPDVEGEAQLPGTRRGHLAELLDAIVGPGRGFELVSHVNRIPKGSRLAVSTNTWRPSKS